METTSYAVIVGFGIFHVIQVETVPSVGSELCLKGNFVSGRFQVTSLGTLTFKEQELPHILVKRVGDANGVEPIPLVAVNLAPSGE